MSEARYNRIWLDIERKNGKLAMKKLITLAAATAALSFGATFTGVITDNMCDNADHKDMKMGSDAKCVTECVKGMNGKYVLYEFDKESVVCAERPEDAGEIRGQEGDRDRNPGRGDQDHQGGFDRGGEVAVDAAMATMPAHSGRGRVIVRR